MELEEIKAIIIDKLSEKLPTEKLMAVPIMLLMIDTKTWKFPEEFKQPPYQEIAEIIENSEELKSIFNSTHNMVNERCQTMVDNV